MSCTPDTRPAPLPAPNERRQNGLSPLRWLRQKLFKADGPGAVDSNATTLANFPPAIGRGRELRRGHRALQRVFEEQPELRQVLPHLNLFEKALARKGSKALRRVPATVLRRALEQLEDLITSEGGSDLPVLRARIIESLALRTASPRTETDPGTLQSIYGVEVLETSHSAFDEVARGWRTTGMPNH